MNWTILSFKGLDGLPYDILKYPTEEMESPDPAHIAAWFIRTAKEWAWKAAGRRRVAAGDRLTVGTRVFTFEATGADIPGCARLKLNEITPCTTR